MILPGDVMTTDVERTRDLFTCPVPNLFISAAPPARRSSKYSNLRGLHWNFDFDWFRRVNTELPNCCFNRIWLSFIFYFFTHSVCLDFDLPLWGTCLKRGSPACLSPSIMKSMRRLWSVFRPEWSRSAVSTGGVILNVDPITSHRNKAASTLPGAQGELFVDGKAGAYQDTHLLNISRTVCHFV